MRLVGSSRSRTLSGRKCYLCARNKMPPMRPEWTTWNWRRRPDLNRGWRFCRPLPYHLATAPAGTVYEDRSGRVLEAATTARRDRGRGNEHHRNQAVAFDWLANRSSFTDTTGPPSRLRRYGG